MEKFNCGPNYAIKAKIGATTMNVMITIQINNVVLYNGGPKSFDFLEILSRSASVIKIQ